MDSSMSDRMTTLNNLAFIFTIIGFFIILLTLLLGSIIRAITHLSIEGHASSITFKNLGSVRRQTLSDSFGVKLRESFGGFKS